MAIQIIVKDKESDVILYQTDPATFTNMGVVLRNVRDAIERGNEAAQSIRDKFAGCVCAVAEGHDGVCHGTDCNCH